MDEMTTRDKIGVASLLAPIVVAGVMAYVDVRDRLARIETKINDGMSSAIVANTQELKEQRAEIVELQRQLAGHLEWAKERSETLQRGIDRRN